MPDSKKPDASKGPGRAYGPPTESRKSSSSKEQPERPPSRGLFSRMRSNSSLSKTRSGEEAPQLDTLQPQRPPSRSRNLFSHSSSSTIVAKPISKDELSQLNSAMSRPSSKLSFNSPKSPGVASPSEDQSSNRNKFSRWLRKDTPIVVEVPKKEFVFVENEALVALTPIERRAIRKAPVYVKTIVPRYRVPANTRRNSIDFNCYEDLFTQDDEIDADVLVPELQAHVEECNNSIYYRSPNLVKVRFPLTGFAIAPGSFEDPKFNVECNRSDYYEMPLIEEGPRYGSNVARKSYRLPSIPPTAAELDRQSVAWAFKNGPDNEDDQFIPNMIYPPRKQAAVQSIILKMMYGMQIVDSRGPVRVAIRAIEKLSDDFITDGSGQTRTISKKIDTYQGKRIVLISKEDLADPVRLAETVEKIKHRNINGIEYVGEGTWESLQEHIVRDEDCTLVQLTVPQHSQLTDGGLHVVLSLMKRTTPHLWRDPEAADKYGAKLTMAEKQLLYNLFHREVVDMVESTIENYFSWRLKRTEFKHSAELPMLRPGEW